jgi:NAD(P)-dependent dehydrogenase (short-subunit alcohol dehydrogenase family)
LPSAAGARADVDILVGPLAPPMAAKGCGSIVNVSSMAAQVGLADGATSSRACSHKIVHRRALPKVRKQGQSFFV